MIAVLGWIDGFGADTCAMGIFESREKAQEYYPYDRDNDEPPLKYTKISLNCTASLDYDDAKYLFSRIKKNL